MTSFGDSPYQSFSAVAGNTHFIDFDNLTKAEFKIKLDSLKSQLIELNSKASSLMDKIQSAEIC